MAGGRNTRHYHDGYEWSVASPWSVRRTRMPSVVPVLTSTHSYAASPVDRSNENVRGASDTTVHRTLRDGAAMPTARWAIVCVSVAVVTTPVAVLSCGSTPGNGAGTDGGSDGTFQEAQGGDAGTDADAPDNALGDGARSDAPLGDAASSPPDSGPCVPGCPSQVTCGEWTDCTGALLVCGTPCVSGQVCIPTSTTPPAQSCQALSCTGKCGVIGEDSCGVGVSCGGCPAGKSCIDNACITTPTTDASTDAGCGTLTCTVGTLLLCGKVSDSCGNTLSCACPAGQQCIGGECSPPPPECSAGDGGTQCGSVENACGSGTVVCGTCTGDTKCVDHACTTCTPPSCAGATCGSVNNGCGPSVSCGTCATKSEVCDNGACCTPTTCAELMEAGTVQGCTTVNLGCGVQQSCLPCAKGDVCDEATGACSACVPKTCSDFGDIGCEHGDGCGNLLDCCGAGTACTGGFCCPPGEIGYEGTCCQPACNTSLPAGPQVSCGVTIYCGGPG